MANNDELDPEEIAHLNELARSGQLYDRYMSYLALTDDAYPLTFDEWLGI